MVGCDSFSPEPLRDPIKIHTMLTGGRIPSEPNRPNVAYIAAFARIGKRLDFLEKKPFFMAKPKGSILRPFLPLELRLVFFDELADLAAEIE